MRSTCSLPGTLAPALSSALSGAAGAPLPSPRVFLSPSPALAPAAPGLPGLCQEQPLEHRAQQLLVLIKTRETQKLPGCDSPCC